MSTKLHCLKQTCLNDQNESMTCPDCNLCIDCGKLHFEEECKPDEVFIIRTELDAQQEIEYKRINGGN